MVRETEHPRDKARRERNEALYKKRRKKTGDEEDEEEAASEYAPKRLHRRKAEASFHVEELYSDK